jgi:hypothetical protein
MKIAVGEQTKEIYEVHDYMWKLLNGCEERIYRRNYDIHFVDLSIKGIFF